jgi:hypothetical protein
LSNIAVSCFSSGATLPSMPALLKKHVDAAEPVDRGLHVPLHVGLVADVGLDGQHAFAAAECIAGGVQAGLVDVHQRHRRAFREEARRRYLADAAGAAGDEDDFVLHAFHVSSVRSGSVHEWRRDAPMTGPGTERTVSTPEARRNGVGTTCP